MTTSILVATPDFLVGTLLVYFFAVRNAGSHARWIWICCYTTS